MKYIFFIEGRIKHNKFSSNTWVIIGVKYLSNMLNNKYKIKMDDVYLKKRKAITTSTIHIDKIGNGLNLHREHKRNRGNHKAVCPICK